MLEVLEPTLNELLAEPIIRQMMASDGVKSDEIRQLMARVGKTSTPVATQRRERVLHVLKMPPNWLYRPGAADRTMCCPK
ncbi:hypothetical protein [Phyllobacterium sp. YR531]|uniref:hypothetical protein n=1 Tax=Phyllobacterium sp. YR531 TaxID=1144343 RepID=UPI00026FC411|nr:hypothetical protein [Phyllobacterium sp. YR531]EJM99438.1 hypothetical protein PMI41_04345 [Phyllobacterium sp. YR531]